MRIRHGSMFCATAEARSDTKLSNSSVIGMISMSSCGSMNGRSSAPPGTLPGVIGPPVPPPGDAGVIVPAPPEARPTIAAVAACAAFTIAGTEAGVGVLRAPSTAMTCSGRSGPSPMA